MVAVGSDPPAAAQLRGEADDWEPQLGLLARLNDLRRRLVRMALALVAGFLIAFAFIAQIVGFVLRPLDARLPEGSGIIYTEPAEAFILDLKVAALVGAVLVSPYLLWQVWELLAPVMAVRARRLAVGFEKAGRSAAVLGHGLLVLLGVAQAVAARGRFSSLNKQLRGLGLVSLFVGVLLGHCYDAAREQGGRGQENDDDRVLC
jgi:hypothetical protein